METLETLALLSIIAAGAVWTTLGLLLILAIV